jgi:hypothetical protein
MNTLTSGKNWMYTLGYKEQQLIAYTYPEVEEFIKADLKIIYLGWFLGDWSLVNNAMYSCANGLQIRSDDVSITGDLFGVTALDEDFTPINQMIKYYKYGFGRTTDYVNEEIRLGRISRENAIDLVIAYDHKCASSYISEYCKYLDISVEFFWKKVKMSTNKELFDILENGFIQPKFKVGVGL